MSREITDKKTIETILEESQYLRLALCRNNRPYIVPMCYGYQNGTIYLHSSKKGTKTDIIKDNPDVCFELDILYETLKSENPCAYNMRYQSVVGFGRAEILKDEDEVRDALKVIISQYHKGDYNIDNLKTDGVLAIRIRIESLHGRENKMD